MSHTQESLACSEKRKASHGRQRSEASISDSLLDYLGKHTANRRVLQPDVLIAALTYPDVVGAEVIALIGPVIEGSCLRQSTLCVAFDRGIPVPLGEPEIELIAQRLKLAGFDGAREQQIQDTIRTMSLRHVEASANKKESAS